MNLTDDLLNDLLDLEEDNEEENNLEAEQDLEEENGEEENEEEMTEEVPELTEKDKLQQAKGGSNLIEDPKFTKAIAKIDKYWNENDIMGKPLQEGIDDEEYLLITSCTEYISVIDREITNIHKFIRDLYLPKFPELETLILNPIEYVKCVMAIKNETDMNKVDLTSFLTPHTIMAVTLNGSSTTGKPLSEKELARTLEACELVLKLDEIKKKVLNYVESRMHIIAPNLSEVVGTIAASQLIAVAGGLEALAAMPACNIQVIGAQRKNMLGFSKAGSKTHLGLFGTMDFVQKAPKEFQIKLVRLLSTNCALAARVDAQRSDPTGSIGRSFKDKMLKRFDKIQEPPPPKMRKPLAVPDDKPRRKRGGKKYRNLKEKTAMTEFRKQANRMKFGADAEEEYRDSGVGFGMLGDTGLGKVKVQVKDRKINLSKKQKANLERNVHSGNANGLASSIIMSQSRGLELYNPTFLAQSTVKKVPENFFNKESGFSTVMRAKQGQSLVPSFKAPQ